MMSPGLVHIILTNVAAMLPSPTHHALKHVCVSNLVLNFVLAEVIDHSLRSNTSMSVVWPHLGYQS